MLRIGQWNTTPSHQALIAVFRSERDSIPALHRIAALAHGRVGLRAHSFVWTASEYNKRTRRQTIQPPGRRSTDPWGDGTLAASPERCPMLSRDNERSGGRLSTPFSLHLLWAHRAPAPERVIVAPSCCVLMASPKSVTRARPVRRPGSAAVLEHISRPRSCWPYAQDRAKVDRRAAARRRCRPSGTRQPGAIEPAAA